jgi:hypothetical protein
MKFYANYRTGGRASFSTSRTALIRSNPALDNLFRRAHDVAIFRLEPLGTRSSHTAIHHS